MSADVGPSWWDIGEYARGLMERHHVAIEFALVPPIRRLDGKGYSSWVACVRVSSRLSDKVWQTAAQRPWGKGGAARTAPGALYACLLEVQVALETRQGTAAQQAAF